MGQYIKLVLRSSLSNCSNNVFNYKCLQCFQVLSFYKRENWMFPCRPSLWTCKSSEIRQTLNVPLLINFSYQLWNNNVFNYKCLQCFQVLSFYKRENWMFPCRPSLWTCKSSEIRQTLNVPLLINFSYQLWNNNVFNPQTQL